MPLQHQTVIAFQEYINGKHQDLGGIESRLDSSLHRDSREVQKDMLYALTLLVRSILLLAELKLRENE